LAGHANAATPTGVEGADLTIVGRRARSVSRRFLAFATPGFASNVPTSIKACSKLCGPAVFLYRITGRGSAGAGRSSRAAPFSFSPRLRRTYLPIGPVIVTMATPIDEFSQSAQSLRKVVQDCGRCAAAASVRLHAFWCWLEPSFPLFPARPIGSMPTSSARAHLKIAFCPDGLFMGMASVS